MYVCINFLAMTKCSIINLNIFCGEKWTSLPPPWNYKIMPLTWLQGKLQGEKNPTFKLKLLQSNCNRKKKHCMYNIFFWHWLNSLLRPNDFGSGSGSGYVYVCMCWCMYMYVRFGCNWVTLIRTDLFWSLYLLWQSVKASHPQNNKKSFFNMTTTKLGKLQVCKSWSYF